MARGPDGEREAHLPATVTARSPRRGEIWSVYAPGRTAEPHQPRPALVVSEDVRNRLSDDVIVVPIFSEGASGPTHVALPPSTGGLRRASVAFCEEITTIARDFLARGPLGAPVPPDVLARVGRAVRRALGEVLPEE